MGYNVSTDGGDACIKLEDLPKTYEILCALNAPENDHLKRGGSFSGGKYTSKWFSWMDADYPSKCKDTAAIFEMLGFETAMDEYGLTFEGFDSESGQEDLFFEAIAAYVHGGMNWVGEDGNHWRWEFTDGQLIQKQGKVVYE